MFAYNAQKSTGSSVEATLSAEWDTRRDAALAAKIRYNLNLAEYQTLVHGGKVVHRGVEITVDEVKPAADKG